MLNVATNNATPANTVRNVVKRSRNSLLISLVFSPVSWVPEMVLGDARVRLHGDRADLVGPVGQVLLGARERERRERDLAQPFGRPERRDPDDLHPDGLGGLHGGGVANAQVAFVGGTPVDHDLAGGAGRAPLDEPVRVQVAVVDPVARQGRRPVAAELVAVLADELAEALDGRLGGGDAVDGAHTI